MFDKYSERARMVVFVARLVAGKNGSPNIDVEHVVEGLVREDQGELASLLGVPPEQLMVPAAHGFHRHFFASETASKILLKLEKQTTGEAIPSSAGIPISLQVGEVFREAKELCVELHQLTVEPLHLLAAVLSDNSSDVSVTLQDSGVTREKVIAAIQNG